jgi:hypothetical protein
LNRNYDWDFGKGEGSSSFPCSNMFRGPYPFSEPETKAMKRFIEEKA